jgi:DNA-binding NarL/FixJ family response regulator
MVRGLHAATAAQARAAAAEFSAALDDACSAGPRFAAIVALAAAARIARNRPNVAAALRTMPPKCCDAFPIDLPAIADFVAIVSAKPIVDRGPAEASALTKREREILQLVSHGLTNKEIAQRLVLSVRTVDAHVEHILSKLNVSSRTRAVAAATRAKILA